MRRLAVVLCAGLLLVSLVPGVASASSPTSNLDQSTAADLALPTCDGSCLQTFTAGKTGQMTGVDLYALAEMGWIEVDLVTVSAGATLASGWIPTSATGWHHVSFSSPYEVVAGTQYALKMVGPGSMQVFGSSDAYAGGGALWQASGSGPWIPFPGTSEFAFRTYVDTVTTDAVWSAPRVSAGAATPLSLTESFTFANGPEAGGYSIDLGTLPTWYTPTQIACSWTSDTADCSLALVTSGVPAFAPNIAGEVLTITLTGTADPTGPGAASVTGEGCLSYTNIGANALPNVDPGCADGTATITVDAAASLAPTASAPSATPTAVGTEMRGGATATAVTPPPTTTGTSPSGREGGAPVPLMLMGLVGAFGAVVALDTRRRRLS